MDEDEVFTAEEMERVMARTRPFDPADFLKTPQAQAAYLDATLADGDAGEVAEALGAIARARGMTAVAEAAGLSRGSLYRSLSREGSTELETVMKVAAALGLRLSAAVASGAEAA